jgi:hypothetical protein
MIRLQLKLSLAAISMLLFVSTAQGALVAQFRADDPGIAVNEFNEVLIWPNQVNSAANATITDFGPTKVIANINGAPKQVLEFYDDRLVAPIAQLPVGTVSFVMNRRMDQTTGSVIGWQDSDDGGDGLAFLPSLVPDGGEADRLFVIARDDYAVGDIISSANMTGDFGVFTITWGPAGIHVFKDGVPSGSNTSITGITQVPGEFNLHIGATLRGNEFFARRFRGQIAEFQIWNEQLNNTARLAAEVELYNRWFATTAVQGDFDSDGDVDGADFVAWQTNFPKESGASLAQGDADNDGDVDGADFVVWQTNFPFTPGTGTTPVPEPAAGCLFLIGAAIVLWQRRLHFVAALSKSA